MNWVEPVFNPQPYRMGWGELVSNPRFYRRNRGELVLKNSIDKSGKIGTITSMSTKKDKKRKNNRTA